MRIHATMSLPGLQELLGGEATEADALRMRRVLVERHDGADTDDISDTQWCDLITASVALADHTAIDYVVTPTGLRQIKAWMRKFYKDEIWDRFHSSETVRNAVYAWAEQAEQSEDGGIELRAWMSRTGHVEHFHPEREARLVDVD